MRIELSTHEIISYVEVIWQNRRKTDENRLITTQCRNLVTSCYSIVMLPINIVGRHKGRGIWKKKRLDRRGRGANPRYHSITTSRAGVRIFLGEKQTKRHDNIIVIALYRRSVRWETKGQKRRCWDRNVRGWMMVKMSPPSRKTVVTIHVQVIPPSTWRGHRERSRVDGVG